MSIIRSSSKPDFTSAAAVVLATGYSDRLYTRSTGTREMSATA